MQRSDFQPSVLARLAAAFVHDGATAGGIEPLEVSPPSREEIARLAYLLAQQRDFHPGGELDDWLAAERTLMEAHAKERRP